MKENYVFLPRTRILFDIILCFAVTLLLVSSFNVIPRGILFAAGGALALIFSFVWFFRIRPVFKVVIADGKITGPSPFFKQQSFSLRKLDHRKILLRTARQKLIGYRDLCCFDGTKIRLCHRLLGKLAVYEIMEIVEKYPFRESEKDDPGKTSTDG